MYVFRCKVGVEMRAQEELEALGLDTLCPTIKKFNRHKPKGKRETMVAAFPGYILAERDPMPWMALKELASNPNKATLDVLRQGDMPVRISSHIVDRVRHMSCVDVPAFRLGDRVEIQSGGAMHGVIGQVLSLGLDRVRVSLDGLGVVDLGIEDIGLA